MSSSEPQWNGVWVTQTHLHQESLQPDVVKIKPRVFDYETFIHWRVRSNAGEGLKEAGN